MLGRHASRLSLLCYTAVIARLDNKDETDIRHFSKLDDYFSQIIIYRGSGFWLPVQIKTLCQRNSGKQTYKTVLSELHNCCEVRWKGSDIR